MAQPQNKTFATDPSLWIFTSLTAGSSHIVTATSRLETILRANRVPFKAVDIATNEKARMLWGRRAGKDANGRLRKLPGLVQQGIVLGDLVEVEEWNEYGELKEKVKLYFDEFTIPTKAEAEKLPAMKSMSRPVSAQTPASGTSAAALSGPEKQVASAIQAAAAIAAKHAAAKEKEGKKKEEEAKRKAEEKPPVRSLADEAADRAKAMRLKGLRDKVEADKKKQEEKEKKEKEEKEKKEKEEKEKKEWKEKEETEESAGTKTEEKTIPTKSTEINISSPKLSSSIPKSPIVVIPPPTRPSKTPSPTKDLNTSLTDCTTEHPIKDMDPQDYDRLRAALQEPSSFAPIEHDARSIAETMDLSSDEEAPRSISESLARLSRSTSNLSLRERVRADREKDHFEMEREWQKLAGKAKELGGSGGESAPASGVTSPTGEKGLKKSATAPAVTVTQVEGKENEKKEA